MQTTLNQSSMSNYSALKDMWAAREDPHHIEEPVKATIRASEAPSEFAQLPIFSPCESVTVYGKRLHALKRSPRHGRLHDVDSRDAATCPAISRPAMCVHARLCICV
jgi:hypothetical protein